MESADVADPIPVTQTRPSTAGRTAFGTARTTFEEGGAEPELSAALDDFDLGESGAGEPRAEPAPVMAAPPPTADPVPSVGARSPQSARRTPPRPRSDAEQPRRGFLGRLLGWFRGGSG